MNIAIMGFRGVPANYGGFETFVEELGPRLVSRGHAVTVYNRAHWIPYKESTYKGMHLVRLPAIPQKYLDTVSHTFLAAVHSTVRDYHVILMLNGANAPFALFPRMTGKKVALNVDGIERKRKKWNRLGRAYLRLNERIATFTPNEIVSDAEVIRDYYRANLNAESTMIPYGASVGRCPTPEIVRDLGLEPDRYVLYVARLEPENNAHVLIEAFRQLETDLQLAIVGDAPYARDYVTSLKSTTDARVKFLGYVYGDGYRALQQSAYAYVQATEVGGTHPALLEAMGFGNYVIANGTPENAEVLGDAGVTYSGVDGLRSALQEVIQHPHQRYPMQQRAMQRIASLYGWDTIADQYEGLFARMAASEDG